MARTPLPINSPILDRNGRPFTRVYSVGRPNLLHEGAQTSKDRPRTPRVDRDWKQNLNHFGFRELMASGRFLYANSPQLKRAVNIIADLAIGQSFVPQYYGPNKEWGNIAENLLFEWHKVMDVRGHPWNWCRLLKTWVKSTLHSGDVGVMFTERASGFPAIQTIPPHRIGANSWNASDLVTEGRYKGFQQCNGVILDAVGRALAYRIYDENQNWIDDIGAVNLVDENDTVVERADMFLIFDPEWTDQSRGVSRIASGINDWRDHKQVQDFLKMALKKEASYAVVEYNETGEVDPQTEFTGAGPAVNGQPAEIYQENVGGGMVQIYKGNTGSDVKFPGGNRPSSEFAKFWENITRSGFASLDMPMEIFDTLDKGGAPLRLIIDIASRTIQNTETLAMEVASRIDAWRLAKGIKRGDLPQEESWWQIEHQGPPELTADKGHAAQIDREDYKLGFNSLKDVTARRGKYWEDVNKQRELETRDVIMRAKAISKDLQVDFQTALDLLQQRSPNPQPAVESGSDDGDGQPAAGGGAGTDEEQKLKVLMDAYGVGVRAGVVTPTLDDENQMRARLGLPQVTEDVRAAWQRDDGTRRPITLTIPGGGRTAPAQPAGDEEEDEDE